MSTDFKLSSYLKALYSSLICPLLEYSSIPWVSFTATDSFHIEQVQRHFYSCASSILQIYHRSHGYRPEINKLGLLSLADRSVEASLVFLH